MSHHHDHDTDFTEVFTDLMNTMKSWADDRQATKDEIGMLMTAAEDAHTAHPAMWAMYADLLKKHLPKATKPERAAIVQRAKVISFLHLYPYSVTDLIPAWMAAKGYQMTYSNQFRKGSQTFPLDDVFDELTIWTNEYGIFKDTVRPAVNLFISQERKRVMLNTFVRLAHNPVVDPTMSELRKFVQMIVRPREDGEATERHYRAAEIVISNFIHRVKNHMAAFAGVRTPEGGARWSHYTHCMPVLFGTQKDGKTLAVKTLMKILDTEDMWQSVGFDFLGHDEKFNALAYQPVMFFDELSGIGKQDAEKIKAIMTDTKKPFRKLYGATATKEVVSSFIGCTNKDLNSLIKDETGNRRFFQIETTKVTPSMMAKIDVLKLWQSVNEDAVAPIMEFPDEVEAIQKQQRHRSVVECWIDECTSIPHGLHQTSVLWSSFKPWTEQFYPHDRTSNAAVFGRELNRLFLANHPRLEQRSVNNANRYEIIPAAIKPKKVTPFSAKPETPREKYNRLKEADALLRATDFSRANNR